MSYLGKILVIVLVALSITFMAFAGAVYHMHVRWKDKYDVGQKQLAEAQQGAKQAQDELLTAKREHLTKLTAESEARKVAEAENIGLKTGNVALSKQNSDLQQQRESNTGLAEAKAAEARFRQEEAEKQRVENNKLQNQLDAISADNRTLQNELFALGENFRNLNKTYQSKLTQLAYLERVVGNQGLETDPEVVNRQHTPPPPVEGMVKKVRKNRAGRVQFVEGTIGSDDGLKTGDLLDVVHVASADSASWLGQVRVMDLGPDWFVGEVVLPSKNGIIQEGDNVTTKF